MTEHTRSSDRPEKHKIAAIILAAGQSKRMGAENKLLCDFKSKPLICWPTEAATNSNCDVVLVITGHEQSQVEAQLSRYRPVFCHNGTYASGMASSVVAGVAKAQEMGADGVIVLLGDMPHIRSEDINRLIEQAEISAPGKIVVATSDGKRGNPVIFPAELFDQLQKLTGDRGAKQVFSQFASDIVEVEIGPSARYDLDTPDAFEQ